MRLSPAPQILVRPSPDVVRRLYSRVQELVAENKERLGETFSLTKEAEHGLELFADAEYFMYPHEKGMVHCTLPGGLSVGVEATDNEYSVITPQQTQEIHS